MRQGPILIQGAMDVETELMASRLTGREELNWGGYQFWKGEWKGKTVVVSRTDIGMVNCAAATTLGIIHFAPCVVINQGIAGAHREDLGLGDIIIGESCATIHDLWMPARGKGEGMAPENWGLHFDGVEADVKSHALTGDPHWVEKFVSAPYTGGKKEAGRLGCGDVFNREYDRICWIRNMVGESCEDMESYAAYQVSHKFGVPCLGLRLISNNELTGLPYHRELGETLQEFVLSVIGD